MDPIVALNADDSSVRLQAALALGSSGEPGAAAALIERCAVEPDFYVRDMLSWALTRLSSVVTLPLLRRELDADLPQARAQALHTLSKIGDATTWAWITPGLLADAEVEVARTAWRAAVVLVPDDDRQELVEQLVAQLGRGDHQVQRSLSRALVALGEIIEPALEKAAVGPDDVAVAHARATELLLQDPDADFGDAIEEARRVVALGNS